MKNARIHMKKLITTRDLWVGMWGDGTYKDCKYLHIVRFGSAPVNSFADRSLHRQTVNAHMMRSPYYPKNKFLKGTVEWVALISQCPMFGILHTQSPNTRPLNIEATTLEPLTEMATDFLDKKNHRKYLFISWNPKWNQTTECIQILTDRLAGSCFQRLVEVCLRQKSSWLA